jgi:hypothetical protein
MAEFEPGAAAPVADAAAPQVVAPQATSDPTPTAGQDAQETHKPVDPDAERTFTKKEVDHIAQKERATAYRRAEREAQQREERIRREVEERVARSQPQPTQPTGEPKVGQFQDYESYIAALTDYKVEQRMQGVRQQTEAQRQAQSQREHAAQIQQKLSSAAAKYADFNEVALADDVPISQPMAAAISRLKDSGEVAYYLGSNIEEAHRISRLDPVDQVWEIKELERKLSAPPAVTKAPPPIVPTSGQSSVKKATFDLPWKEFVKQRRREEGRG